MLLPLREPTQGAALNAQLVPREPVRGSALRRFAGAVPGEDEVDAVDQVLTFFGIS